MDAEYDALADDYDATREPATEVDVKAISDALEGCTSVLDVGVGTGRFAKPLSERGFEVTGADLSRNMLMKARGKGLERLVVGDGYSLPFREGSFDGAVIIHVLHVVVDWAGVMKEIGRVTRGNVVSIFRQRPDSRAWSRQVDPVPSQYVAGHPVRTRNRMWENEREAVEKVPPIKIVRIRDEIIAMTAEEAIRQAQSSPTAASGMSPELQKEMFQRIIAFKGGSQVHRRVVDELVVWSSEQLRSLPG